jgi:hypothetical protein
MMASLASEWWPGFAGIRRGSSGGRNKGAAYALETMASLSRARSGSYEDTQIDVSKGERWFCTEEEAKGRGVASTQRL